VLVAYAPAVRAGTPDEEPSARADRLFREAEAFFDFGDIARACSTWADSLRVQPKLGTLLNLALCHETLGRIATAWKQFHYGAAWAAQNGQKDRQKFAHDHASQLEPRLPRLTLQLDPDQHYATIEIDGEPLPEPEWVLPFYVDPGAHTIAVTAPGKLRKVLPVNVTAAPSSQTIVVGQLDDFVRPPPPPPPPRYERTWMTNAGIGAVVAGSGMLLSSMYFGYRAADGRDDLRGRCDGNRCLATGITAYERVQSDANVSTWLGLGGLVVLGAGAALIVYDPKREVRDGVERPATKKPGPALPALPARSSWSLKPVIGGAGVFAEGRF